MTRVILSTTEFLNTLKPGGGFWCVTSLYGKPTGVEGPFVISRIDTEHILCGEPSPKVFLNADSPAFQRGSYAGHPFETQRLVEKGFFINDLTHPDHGVLLTESEEEALAYLEERKLAFQNDSAAVARSEEWREMSRADGFLSDYFPEDYDGELENGDLNP
ncbi:MAG: hypothetical protein LiPW15_110 [Parcubacteria group bacterium LiPW_15]|nr:MAG: hypothetical protein LiPW15_110 [Parcubacteria group bacterium LiPW_15]